MSSSAYVKAVLYRELSIFSEPVDERKKSWKRKQKRVLENED